MQVGRSPVGDAVVPRHLARRIGHRDRKALRRKKIRHPVTHLAASADDQRAASGSPPLRRHPCLLLRRERAADQRLQQRFRECRRNAKSLRVPPRLQQHFALTAEVTGRLAGRALDLGDLLAEGLPLGDELQQFTVDDVEPGAEFF